MLVTKRLQKRVRMEIRGSDGIPFIPFSTGYVILLWTVQLLCIDCASAVDCALTCCIDYALVYPFVSVLPFL